MYFNIHKEKRCHKSGLFSNISPHVNQRRKFRRQTYHMWDIDVELNVSFHWFHLCYNSEILGWCETDESVYFSVCCSASNVYGHSLWESTPTMHCMDLMHHVSYSLWADGKKKDQPINFDLSFGFWLRWIFFFWCWRVLVVPCYPGSYWSSACISSTKPLCKLQTWRTLHFRRWGLSLCKYGILMCKPMNCLVGGVCLYEAVKGPRLGFKGDVHNVYMISTLFWDLQLRTGCIYITS